MCHRKELHVCEAVALVLLLDRKEVKDLKAPCSQLSYTLEKQNLTARLQFEPHGYGSDL